MGDKMGNSKKIVSTNVNYSYNVMQRDILMLKKTYPFLEVSSMGKSVLENNLPIIRLGDGPNEVFYSASFHANEWITTPLLMKFIENFCMSYVTNSNIYGHSAKEIFNNTSIYLAPMVNPDGVNLLTDTYSHNSSPYMQAQQIASLYPDIPFPNGWKANIHGVDLNLQYPAGWEQAREIKFAQGFTQPSPRDYVGPTVLSEPESQSIYNFTLSKNFRLVLAYHTQGKVIFWQFQDYTPPEARLIGQKFSVSSGYPLEDTPYNSSFAGYKDWFIKEYRNPGYTIEAGIGENPLPISQFDEIYADNEGILVLGAIL